MWDNILPTYELGKKSMPWSMKMFGLHAYRFFLLADFNKRYIFFCLFIYDGCAFNFINISSNSLDFVRNSNNILHCLEASPSCRSRLIPVPLITPQAELIKRWKSFLTAAWLIILQKKAPKLAWQFGPTDDKDLHITHPPFTN